jgi:putative NADPH-quinone reductase
MGKRIAVIDGHPDPGREHFVHALADAYMAGAREAGHEVRLVTVAALDFPVLRSPAQWLSEPIPPGLAGAAETIAWAEHLVLLYPLWLGDVPALFKAFLEQVARPGTAFRHRGQGFPEKLWKGRSARVIVTMGMPGLFYRLVYRAHSLKSLERNVLKFVGVRPVNATVIGMIESSPEARAGWLAEIRKLGGDGD